jgi:hypothetical protein
MFLDLDDKIIFYFDSANNLARDKDVRGRVRNSASTNGSKIYKKTSTRTKSNECGMYSIFFIVTMLTGDIGRSTPDDEAAL